MLDHVGRRQWLTRTDEARIHLRNRAGNDLDKVALDPNLRFRGGQGVKSRCKVKSMQRRLALCSIEIESHRMKCKALHPVRQSSTERVYTSHEVLCGSSFKQESPLLVEFARLRATLKGFREWLWSALELHCTLRDICVT
jgi:hypothetical protein